MKNKILVIEDDRAISELLCMNLEGRSPETALMAGGCGSGSGGYHAAGKRRVCTYGGF